MKKVVISVLALAFLVSVSGCTCKSEHDKVLKEKALIENRYTQLTHENARLKGQISTQQKMKEDLAKLIQKNARLEAESSKLQKEKESLEQQLKQATAKAEILTSE
jgi:septal ring factor EnvC (AmiA/AmiB activator)